MLTCEAPWPLPVVPAKWMSALHLIVQRESEVTLTNAESPHKRGFYGESGRFLAIRVSMASQATLNTPQNLILAGPPPRITDDALIASCAWVRGALELHAFAGRAHIPALCVYRKAPSLEPIHP